jgi:hypothetical protein
MLHRILSNIDGTSAVKRETWCSNRHTEILEKPS